MPDGGEESLGGQSKVRSRTRRRPRRLGAGGPEEDPQGWTAAKQAPFNRRQRGKRSFRGLAAVTAARRICLGRARDCRGEKALTRSFTRTDGLIGTCFTAGSNEPRGVRVCVSAGHRSADPPVAPLTPHLFLIHQTTHDRCRGVLEGLVSDVRRVSARRCIDRPAKILP